MTKIVYRKNEEGYYSRRSPEEPVRMGLRGNTHSREQSFCRGVEREQQIEQRRDTYTDEEFDMYRDDVPHRRTASRKIPIRNKTDNNRLPLWIVCSLISAVGLFSIFSNVLSVQMLGLQLGSFSPFELLLGEGTALYEDSGIIDPKVTAATAAAFGVSLFLFLRYKEETFSKIFPVLLLSIVPAGVMVFFISNIAKIPTKVLDINVGLGVYLQIICSAALTIITLIGYSMTTKNTSRKNVSYGFR